MVRDIAARLACRVVLAKPRQVEEADEFYRSQCFEMVIVAGAEFEEPVQGAVGDAEAAVHKALGHGETRIKDGPEIGPAIMDAERANRLAAISDTM